MAQSNTKYSSISLFWWNRKKCEDKKERMEDAYKLYCPAVINSMLTAIRRMEKEERNTQAVCVTPVSLQKISCFERLKTRSSWLNCALRGDVAVYWVSIGHQWLFLGGSELSLQTSLKLYNSSLLFKSASTVNNISLLLA